MGAKNRVIAGAYAGKQVLVGVAAQAGIALGVTKRLYLNKTTVENYEVIADNHSKSATSGAVRGMIGGALLGGAGMIAGALSAKEKGVYTISIQFKDGKKSMLEVDEKVYKAIVQACF